MESYGCLVEGIGATAVFWVTVLSIIAYLKKQNDTEVLYVINQEGGLYMLNVPNLKMYLNALLNYLIIKYNFQMHMHLKK